MKATEHFNVYWRQIHKKTFMYGARIQFKDKEAFYSNRLMPSGTMIHEWYMRTNFYHDRTFPTLPLLKKGVRYRFKFHISAIPENSVYFKIVFYKRNGTTAEVLIAKESEIKVEMPSEAYEYRVQMMNAAMTSLHFKRIEIIVDEQSDPTLDTHQNEGGTRFETKNQSDY